VRHPRPRPVAVGLAVAAMITGACSSGTKSTAAPPVTVSARQAALAAMLPPAVARAKVLTVGSDISYAPNEFTDPGSGTAKGMDVDLCGAIATEFGDLSCKFSNVTFDELIPGLQSSRFDLIFSSMTDNKGRQARVDFVDYFTAGTAILVTKGNPKKVQTLDDLCGQTVGLQRGTTQEDLAKQQNTRCPAGRSITILTFDKDTDALLALKAGRSVADMNDFPVAAYNAKTSGGGNDFEVVGRQLASAPYGIGVRKDDNKLRDAIAAALKAAQSDGSYDRVLDKWSLSDGALKGAPVNSGT
jgi:polar amino acid transport system substrate-binding protein